MSINKKITRKVEHSQTIYNAKNIHWDNFET